MTIALRMRRKLNEFRMTNFLELASPLLSRVEQLWPVKGIVIKKAAAWCSLKDSCHRLETLLGVRNALPTH